MTTILHTDAITVDVTDVDGDITSIVPLFTLDDGSVELAHDFAAVAFTAPYSSSSRSVLTGPDGFQYVFTRDAGWPGGTLSLQVIAYDSAGGITTETFPFDVTPPTLPSEDPVITLVSPAPGALGRYEDIIVDVTDPDNDLATVVPIFTTVVGVELAHNFGTPAFIGAYAAASTRSAIANGFRYTFDRGGWPGSSVSLTVSAYDGSGHSAADAFAWTVAADVPAEEEGGELTFDSARGVADIAVEWADGIMDLVIRADDIGFDSGLRTAVLLSLFTDRRAEEDDALPSADGDRRGWWADEFAPVDGDRLGSRLWLLDRSAQRPDLVRRVEEMVREALAWMLEDRVTERIDVEIETRREQLFYTVTLARPEGDHVSFRFAHVWDGEEAR